MLCIVAERLTLTMGKAHRMRLQSHAGLGEAGADAPLDAGHARGISTFISIARPSQKAKRKTGVSDDNWQILKLFNDSIDDATKRRY